MEVTRAGGPFSGLIGYDAMKLFKSLPTPSYVLDEARLIQNGEILAGLRERTGCRILLAQKAFSNYDLYPVLSPYVSGTEASGLYEARLGHEKMPGKETHVFSAAYRYDEFQKILEYADHIVFNSPGQLKKYGHDAFSAGKSIGLRVNPELSTQEHGIYDPCAPGSRLGTTRAEWDAHMTPELISMLDGLHFHTLCEQNADALEATLVAVKEKFGEFLPKMKWINFGGGHHITKSGYDTARLERCINDIRRNYCIDVYLEPGEAWALNAGYFVTRVLDITENGSVRNAIIDGSAACHMPDVIEMPYRPPLFGAGDAGEKPYEYVIGGPTCLAGDVAGTFTFEKQLSVGDTLIFGDMAIYTTCKNNTFNGMKLPDIYVLGIDGSLKPIAHFGYEDFLARLGS